MDSALTPREIQSRIRAGESVDDVARAAGVDPAELEDFSAPVLAERAYMAELAHDAQARRSSGPIAHSTLGQAIERRLESAGIDPADIEWDAWRDPERADRHWTIRVSYADDGTDHEALFDFDPRGRYTIPTNADARQLVDDEPTPATPRTRFKPDPDMEPTLDLNDELAIVRAVQDEKPAVGDGSALQELYAAAAANNASSTGGDGDGLRQVDGVYDIVPNPTSDMDALYDVLSGFDEDSVHVYEGLSTPVAMTTDEPAEDDSHEPAEDDRPKTGDSSHDETDGTGRTTDESEPPQDDQTSKETKAPEKVQTSDAAPTDDAGSVSRAEQETLLDSEIEPSPAAKPSAKSSTKKTRRRHTRRATVPTWDEIMFGEHRPESTDE